MKVDSALEEHYEEMGDNHASSAEDTPLREDAFVLSDE
ncbi:MAG: GTP cyclohydrolase I, partial [Sediminicola sp.]